MKRLQRLALVLSVLILASVVPANARNASPATIQQLKKIKQEWSKAEMDNNAPFLNKLWADDCIFGTSMGTVMTKQQLMPLFKGKSRKVTELRSDDIHIRQYGNVAIMTDQTTMHAVLKGKPYGGVYRYIRIFVKESGQWRVVLVQATPLKATLP
ncbi:MAG: nuclear transport factor 2 family protein [Terriglobia bacterium]